MANEDCWPPKSARQAFLSSPSGRRKYQDLVSSVQNSPTKPISGTPSLLERLRASRVNQDRLMQMEDHRDEEMDDEEDEETLELKLAAIQAKLKLKKLQQNKARQNDATVSQPFLSKPILTTTGARLEVPLSPPRRPQVQERSPGRVLLGIDKGLKGADVSLRRARTINTSPSKDRHHGENNVRSDVARKPHRPRPDSQQSHSINSIKPFSQRMSEMRDDDRTKQAKNEAILRARTNGFRLDRTEMDALRSQAEHGDRDEPKAIANSSAKHKLDIQKENDDQQHRSQSRQNLPPGERTISRSRSHLELRRSPSKTSLTSDDTGRPGDASLFEDFSGFNLSSRILPHTFLKRTIPSSDFTVYRIPGLLKTVTAPAFEVPENVINFVVFGIVASKSSPLDHKLGTAEKFSKGSDDWEKKWNDGSENRKKFMVITLTDLKWTVELYLFDKALPRYHRLSLGTVIAILNPSIMPPRKGREDTGAFSLSLNDGEDQVLEIGKSKDLGFCNVIKKNGQPCDQWVNAVKTEICEWHLNTQIAKTQAQRMGVNAGSNGFFQGNGGSRIRNQLESTKGLRGGPTEGHQYDSWTGSHYYISASNTGMGSRTGSAPIYNAERSTAKLIDANSDDPFVAEGQLSRDREALMQKRMAAQEKERQIAKKLEILGSGGVGRDYMKETRQSNQKQGYSSLKSRDQENTNPIGEGIMRGILTSATKTTVLSSDTLSEVSRKRTAESVRLSPVKKTRFLTEKGIKEAGRESFGGPTSTTTNNTTNEDNDDDDLDIV